MIIIDGILAFLISSALDTNPLKILVCCFFSIWLIFYLKENDWKLYFSNEAIVLFFILIIALVNSAYFYVFSEFSFYVDNNQQMLGIRKFSIEVTFGFFMYLYLKTKSYDFILNLVYIGALANCIVALIQLPLVLNTSYRASMLFFEPSSAGFYYCFSIFLLFMGAGSDKTRKWIAVTFSILGLIAFSKAQFLVLAIVALICTSYKLKLISIIMILTMLGFFNSELNNYYDYLVDNNLQLYGLDRLVDSITQRGILGLSNAYEVSDTYVTRLSGIYVSFMTLIDYPFGIGAATFNPVYKQYLIDHNLVNVFDGGEVDLMLRGEAWASPRSRILELVVAAGFIGIIGLAYIFKSFHKERNKSYLIYVAFISTFIAGVMLELNPIIDYFVVLILLLERIREGSNEKNN